MEIEVKLVIQVKDGETTSSTRTRLRDHMRSSVRDGIFTGFEIANAKMLYPSRQYESYGECDTCGAAAGKPCVYLSAGFTSATGVWREHQPGEPTLQVHHGRPGRTSELEKLRHIPARDQDDVDMWAPNESDQS